MSGLLLKDFYILKKYMTYAVIFLVVSVFEPTLLPIMSIIFITLLGMTSFSYDDMAKWDKYANVLPITRKQIIGEKYIFILICILAVTLVDIIFFFVL